FFSFVFCSSSGGFGRASKACFASPVTRGGGIGGFGAGGLRWLRCATASSSATRSFSLAHCSVSCATVASSAATCARSSLFSLCTAAASSTRHYRSRLGAGVDPLTPQRTAVPTPTSRGEVETGEDGGEGGAADLD